MEHKALITGATGLVGRALLEKLGGANILSRDPARARVRLGGLARPFAWSGSKSSPPEAFKGVDAVFHLAGEPVAEGRWTAAKKERIRRSRVEGTRALVSTLAQLSQPPRVLVVASAVGFYGDRGEEVLEESAPGGSCFLAQVCADWEAEALAAIELGIRTVVVRIGIVLSPDGGALARMVKPFRIGLGGRLGSGRQWMPWIHIDDLVGLLLHAARDEQLQGPMNGAAPGPVTNRDFTATLGSVLHRPALLAVPALGLRLALGELSGALLASQRVEPAVARRTGYRFRYPDLQPALERCLIDPSASTLDVGVN